MDGKLGDRPLGKSLSGMPHHYGQDCRGTADFTLLQQQSLASRLQAKACDSTPLISNLRRQQHIAHSNQSHLLDMICLMQQVTCGDTVAYLQGFEPLKLLQRQIKHFIVEGIRALAKVLTEHLW